MNERRVFVRVAIVALALFAATRLPSFFRSSHELSVVAPRDHRTTHLSISLRPVEDDEATFGGEFVLAEPRRKWSHVFEVPTGRYRVELGVRALLDGDLTGNEVRWFETHDLDLDGSARRIELRGP